jgi:hypothetical protein
MRYKARISLQTPGTTLVKHYEGARPGLTKASLFSDALTSIVNLFNILDWSLVYKEALEIMKILFCSLEKVLGSGHAGAA